MAQKHLPDLILLDVMMPEQDRLGTMVGLKDDPKTKNVSIEMLTANNFMQN